MITLGRPTRDPRSHIETYPVLFDGVRVVSHVYRGASIWTDEDVPGDVTFTCVEDALRYIAPILENDLNEYAEEQRS